MDIELGKKFTPLVIAVTFVASSVLASHFLSDNAIMATAALNPPRSSTGEAMYLPKMPACEGRFGTLVPSLSSPMSSFGAGYHRDNNRFHWNWALNTKSTAGNDLDWYWLNMFGLHYGVWDLGELTTKVRVYPSVIEKTRIYSYTVRVSVDGKTYWDAIELATYIDDVNAIKTHDGIKDYQSPLSFRYVKITSNFGYYTSIDAVQSCFPPQSDAKSSDLIVTTLGTPLGTSVLRGTANFLWMTASLTTNTTRDDLDIVSIDITDSLARGTASGDVADIFNTSLWADLNTTSSERGDAFETRISDIIQPSSAVTKYQMNQRLTIPIGKSIKVALIGSLRSSALVNSTHTHFINRYFGSDGVYARGFSTGERASVNYVYTDTQTMTVAGP